MRSRRWDPTPAGELREAVGGDEVEQRPEWVDLDFGTTYRLTMRVIGGGILLCQPTGYGTLVDCEGALEATARVAEEVFGKDRPYVQIEDYGRLDGASFEARRYFIERMRTRKALVGLVFCGTTSLMRLSVKLGAKLVLTRVPVRLVETLEEAVHAAARLLTERVAVNLGGETMAASGQTPAGDRPSRGQPEPGDEATTRAGEPSTGQVLDLDGLSVEFEIIGGRVIHAVTRGHLEERHVEPIVEMNEQMARRLAGEPATFSLVIGLAEVGGASMAARRRYVEAMRAWYQRRPFEQLVFYGVNRVLQAAITISRPFVPFSVRVARNLHQALEIANGLERGSDPMPPSAGETAIPCLLRPDVEELLAFLGNLDWDRPAGEDFEEVPGSEGALAPVFDALRLIRSDVAQMIEARAHAERALQVEKAYLERLFEAAQVAIVVTTAGGRVERVNSEFTRLFGYSAEEAVGQHIDDLVAPSDIRDEASQLTRLAAAGHLVARERVRRRKDGSELHALVMGSPIVVDEESVAVYAIYQDVTERVLAERALAASEERYRTIVESLIDGYYELDRDGAVAFSNEACLHILGKGREEVVGGRLVDVLDGAGAPSLLGAVRRVAGTGQAETTPPLELLQGGGAKVVVESSIAPILDEQLEVTGLRGILRDVTARVNAEGEREQLEAQLQQSQRLEAIGTLAGGIAHNFNNLLTGILGNVSLLRLEGEPLGGRAEERLRTVEGLVESGAQLTRQLLGYARGGRIEVGPLDLNALVRATAGAIAGARRDIRLHLDLAEQLPAIRADRVQVEQILLNLLVNALDAMPRGGDLYLGTRTIAHDAFRDTPYRPAAGEYVWLSVRDTGVGMDEATRQRVFEPFFTTKGLGRGTGLGLSSVFGIVKAHAGYIDVESQPDIGSTFNVFLPATSEPVVEHGRPAAGVTSGRGTVLLVDDEPSVLQAISATLRAMGYTVLTATSGLSGIELFERNRTEIDLVILDMVLPDVGGGEVFDRLRAIDSAVKVVLASGYSVNGEAARILERGCSEFIQKPFTVDELGRALQRLLTGDQPVGRP